MAVPDALEQVLNNLLTNALRIAPPGSAVTIDGLAIVECLVRAGGGQITLEQAPGTGVEATI